MEYEKALRIGAVRAEAAAAVLEGQTGLKAHAVCCVRPREGTGISTDSRWESVGRECFKEVAVFPGKGKDCAVLGIVDRDAVFKACLEQFVPARRALELAEKVGLTAAVSGNATLRGLMEERHQAEMVRTTALRIDM